MASEIRHRDSYSAENMLDGCHRLSNIMFLSLLPIFRRSDGMQILKKIKIKVHAYGAEMLPQLQLSQLHEIFGH